MKAKGTLLSKCNRRPPSSTRGYSSEWQRIRAEVFREWHIPPAIARHMHIHHTPRWPSLGRDHSLYHLLPVPHSNHSRHTLGETHAGIPAAWHKAVPGEGELFAPVDLEQPARFDPREWE